MSHSYFTDGLAPLASERYQAKFGVGTNLSEYIVASEPLQGAHECIEKLNSKPFESASGSEAQSFSPEVKSQLREIEILLQSQEWAALENLNWASLMKTPFGWLSTFASKALSAFGFILEEWEKDELEVKMRSNNSVERDHLQAALAGYLRGLAATAVPHVKR